MKSMISSRKPGVSPFERTLLVTDRSRSGFGTLVILLASAATTTDGSDHLSTGDNRDTSNARKRFAA